MKFTKKCLFDKPMVLSFHLRYYVWHYIKICTNMKKIQESMKYKLQ